MMGRPSGYNSLTAQMVAHIAKCGGCTTAELARHFYLDTTIVFNTINHRRNKPGGVVYIDKVWRPIDTQPASDIKPSVAAMREPPTFKPWTGHGSAGPIRPGARDYEAIPSLMAGQRVPHHIVDGRVNTQSFGKRKVFSPR